VGRIFGLAASEFLQNFSRHPLGLAESGQVVLKFTIKAERIIGTEPVPQDHVAKANGMGQDRILG